MFNNLKPYPAYKDSEVAWLGEVPEHWNIVPNRATFQELKEIGHPDEQMLSVTITQGVILQSSLLSDTSKKDSSTENKSKYKLVCPGDIAYNKMRAWQGAVGASGYQGIVSPAYIVVRPRENHNPRFFHYLFRTPVFTKEAERWSYGISSDQWSLRPEEFKQIYCCVPPLPEQTAIVRYLDYMDRRIRRYINAKKKLITLLNEQKQAIIHQAVTRGLNPNVRLKPSGVEWLGNVPESWGVASVKRHYNIQLGKMLQTAANNTTDIAVPYLKAQHVQWFSVRMNDLPTMWASPSEIRQFSVREGDLLVCEGGEGGRCSLLHNIDTPVIIQNALHRVRPTAGYHNEFLQYVLNAVSASGYFDALNNKATIAHFTRDKFGALEIPVPPDHEQSGVIKFLNDATINLDATIANVKRESYLLREYRTRLIADVVTGKLDVREAAASLPEEAEGEPLDDIESTAGFELTTENDDTNPTEEV